MIHQILPAALSGTVPAVPSSKSQVHRLMIAAFLSGKETVLEGITLSRDTEATANCLTALGARVSESGDSLILRRGSRPVGETILDCGDSASTLRFLLPVSAALGTEAVFTGRGRLPVRPLSPLYEEMTAHGARMSAPGIFPLRLRGKLTAGRWRMAGNVSSQFFTGLLLALPLLDGDSILEVLGPLESEPYVNLTLEILKRFGIRILRTEKGFVVPGNQQYRGPEQIRAEADWSSAAFWLAAGALSREGITCRGLNPDSAQGDRAILAILRDFGAEVFTEKDTVTVRSGDLQGIDLDAAQIPDLVPVIAVLASCAAGETRIRSVARLRLKESDRVASLLALLRALGGRAEASGNEMIIHGSGGFAGGVADSSGDHRIAMAAAVAASRSQKSILLRGAEAVEKSYPEFWDEFRRLGGQWHSAESDSVSEI